MKIKVEKMAGSIHDCECCGMYSAEGVFISVNDKLVWKRYSDGHLYGNATEESILNAILNAWLEIKNQEAEKEFTEQARLNWNKSNPGNGIARTPESWLEYKQSQLSYFTDTIKYMKEECSHLPYDETLQAKMIALWFESTTGEKIDVDVTDISESKAEKNYLG